MSRCRISQRHHTRLWTCRTRHERQSGPEPIRLVRRRCCGGEKFSHANRRGEGGVSADKHGGTIPRLGMDGPEQLGRLLGRPAARLVRLPAIGVFGLHLPSCLLLSCLLCSRRSIPAIRSCSRASPLCRLAHRDAPPKRRPVSRAVRSWHWPQRPFFRSLLQQYYVQPTRRYEAPTNFPRQATGASPPRTPIQSRGVPNCYYCVAMRLESGCGQGQNVICRIPLNSASIQGRSRAPTPCPACRLQPGCQSPPSRARKTHRPQLTLPPQDILCSQYQVLV